MQPKIVNTIIHFISRNSHKFKKFSEPYDYSAPHPKTRKQLLFVSSQFFADVWTTLAISVCPLWQVICCNMKLPCMRAHFSLSPLIINKRSVCLRAACDVHCNNKHSCHCNSFAFLVRLPQILFAHLICQKCGCLGI